MLAWCCLLEQEGHCAASVRLDAHAASTWLPKIRRVFCAQRVATLKDNEDAPADVKKVYELVHKHVLSEFGEGPDHKTVRPLALPIQASCAAPMQCDMYCSESL